MAKQRGVVQLSGRVDNLCYYQQKGIRGGLVRRVNLAMGERVKSDPEYQNFRTANSYFGACSMYAGAILNMTGSRASFLHKGSRQAILTKSIFDMQKKYNSSSVPGEVIFSPERAFYLPLVYDEVVKNKMSKYMPSVPFIFTNVASEATAVVSIPEAELNNFCLFNNCIGIRFLWTDKCSLYSVFRDPQTNKFNYPDVDYNRGRNSQDWFTGASDMEIHLESSGNDDACRFAILIALPIVRRVGTRALTKNTGSCARLIGMYD